MKKCPKCNWMIDNDLARFCKKCGTNVENEPIIKTDNSDEVIVSAPVEDTIIAVENEEPKDALSEQPQVQPQAQLSYEPQAQNPGDGSHTGFNALSFFIPIVGLILYFVWSDKLPVRASKCATWAWIGFGIGFTLNLLSMILVAYYY